MHFPRLINGQSAGNLFVQVELAGKAGRLIEAVSKRSERLHLVFDISSVQSTMSNVMSAICCFPPGVYALQISTSAEGFTLCHGISQAVRFGSSDLQNDMPELRRYPSDELESVMHTHLAWTP